MAAKAGDNAGTAGPSIQVVFGVRSGLRRPRRLTVRAIADEAPLAVFYALRVPRAVHGAGRGSPPAQLWS